MKNDREWKSQIDQNNPRTKAGEERERTHKSEPLNDNVPDLWCPPGLDLGASVVRHVIIFLRDQMIKEIKYQIVSTFITDVICAASFLPASLQYDASTLVIEVTAPH